MTHLASNKIKLTLLLLLTLCISGCFNSDKKDISALLDARDSAVTKHDILAYHALLLPDYHDKKKTEAMLVIEMNALFKQFDRIIMTTDSRIIRMQGENQALCEQNYQLRVLSDNTWRELFQREQISVTRTPSGWKLSGGL
ncbi:MAG: hypothetical protein Q9M31_02615 [Mariprofundus sp.]|nr:hypothetical protein [Mariprofundus sp.]